MTHSRGRLYRRVGGAFAEGRDEAGFQGSSDLRGRGQRRLLAGFDRGIRPDDGWSSQTGNGCTQRSFGFGGVRSSKSKPLQTASFGELKRTGANARQRLPCRRSWVRVPSSA